MKQFEILYTQTLNSLKEDVSIISQLLKNSDPATAAALAKLAANNGDSNTLNPNEKNIINKFSSDYQNITSLSKPTSATQPTQQTTSKTATNPISTQISSGTIINPVTPS